MESVGTSDPITWTGAIEEALTACLVGFRDRAGVIALVGEAGIGKTVIARILVRGLRDAGHQAGLIVISPSFASLDVLALMAREWGVVAPPARVPLLHDLQRLMTMPSADLARRPVVVVDACEQMTDLDLFGDLRYLRGSGPRGIAPPGLVVCVGRPDFLPTFQAIFPPYRQLDIPTVVRRLTRAEIELVIADAARRIHSRPRLLGSSAIELLATRCDGCIGPLALDLDRIFRDPRYADTQDSISADDLSEFLDTSATLLPPPNSAQ